ncbi:hypothetical protein EMGBS3_15890 [Anaerolineaceae bacterium]|nr:hypothetical protein EMGBS3_15890 [Anaerolineaceae bacterium]
MRIRCKPHPNLSAGTFNGWQSPPANQALQTVKYRGTAGARWWGIALLAVYFCAACGAAVPAGAATPTTPVAASPAANVPTAAPTVQPTVAAAVACGDDVEFVSDLTVPDFSKVAPGTALNKQWQVRNSGTCAWGPQHRVIFVDGNNLGATVEHALYPALPGTLAVVNVSMVAPAAAGDYEGYWRLSDAKGEPFGSRLYIKITVAAPQP